MLKITEIQKVRTSKEASQFLGLVGMAHTIDEAIVLVRLHPGLDAVKGERSESRQDAGGTGGHFGTVSFNEPLLFVRDEGLLVLLLLGRRVTLFGSHGVSWPTLIALVALTSAGALGRHGRRLKLGTILLEGCEFSWHAFWQRVGLMAVASRQ